MKSRRSIERLDILCIAFNSFIFEKVESYRKSFLIQKTFYRGVTKTQKGILNPYKKCAAQNV